MNKQRTIAKELSLSGIGLHTANKVEIKFKPAEINSGITFVRSDLPGKPQVRACIGSLLPQSRGPRRTSIGGEDFEIQTIEHLMASLAGMGIDNIRIEINNNEVPGLDGSSSRFFEILSTAGVKEQEKERIFFRLKEPVFIEEGNCSIVALPSSVFKISYTLDYNHEYLKTQFLEVEIGLDSFKKELGSARTFCLEDEAAELQRQGLGKGANYQNTLVIGKNGVINNKLRYENEFIRHKIVDLLGDLYLIGAPLKAHIISLKSGHSLNLKLSKRIAEQMARYSLGAVGAGYQPAGTEQQLDARTIMKILPHRQPFLFVDKIIALEKGKYATGIKNVTINDYFFKGHFPGRPVMPGVLIVEAIAQVGGVMMLSPEQNRGKLAFFLAADNIKFRKTVVPGDQLILDVVVGKIKSKTGQVHGKALVDGKVVVEADLMFALVDA